MNSRNERDLLDPFAFIQNARAITPSEPSAVREPAGIEPDVAKKLNLSSYSFDAQALKRDFPILRERVNGRPLVWLDNAATTQKPIGIAHARRCSGARLRFLRFLRPQGVCADRHRVVYGKSEVLEHMQPWQGGGNMIQDVTFEKTIYQAPPQRFEAGTGNIADAVGLGAAIDYLDRVGMANITRHEHVLLTYATEELQRISGLRIIGTAREKAGVLSFVMDGFRTEEIGDYLNRNGIAVRSDHHCAQPILRRFGLESTVRASLALYNTFEDIDALVHDLRDLRLGRNTIA